MRKEKTKDTLPNMRFHRSYSLGFLLSFGLLFVSAIPASAHVIVTPKTVGVAAFQTFSVAVPAEKDTPTIGLRLLIPQGVKFVTPNVHPGWTIDVKKNGTGDDAIVTEIDWTGGSIPPDQRDEFSFNAQVPAKETTLKWKAYQQYADGSTVEWVHDPTSNPEDDSAPPPYSTTNIVNDLAVTPIPEQATTDTNSLRVISYAALAIGVVSLSLQLSKRNKQ